MTEANSFEQRHDDYAFFLAHTTEPAMCRGALLAGLETWRAPSGAARLLDFGCGGGEFLEAALAAWANRPRRLAVALVDIDRSALAQAARRLAPFSSEPVAASSRLGDVVGEFVLVLSNHALYYTGDAADVVRALLSRIAPGGIGVWALGGRENQLCRLWEIVFARAGEPLPFETAETVRRALESAGATFDERVVRSVLEFPDTRENRAKIARFVFGPRLPRFGPKTVAADFDRWKSGEFIRMENADISFFIRPQARRAEANAFDAAHSR